MKISSSHQFTPPYISGAAWGVRVRWLRGVGRRAVLLCPFLLQLLGEWRRVWSMSGSGIFSQLLFPRLKFSAFWDCESRGGRTFGDVSCLVDVADSLVNTFCSLGATFMQEGLAGPPHRPVSWIQVQILLQSGKSLIETESTPVPNGVQWKASRTEVRDWGPFQLHYFLTYSYSQFSHPYIRKNDATELLRNEPGVCEVPLHGPKPQIHYLFPCCLVSK